ncbi:hypothetical protein L6164_030790 [Bauhinia variegata]|uniref:Uncharacterized protein n=1 Tax=Bauhinia variegata TaxID=167791 RepID=A0ACB9LDT8_BAUVA|nr:hypothetical protein L6164_030790 [Bauhinia variegata]
MAIGFMEVELVKAKGLQNTDIFGAIEPYVVVQYKNQEIRSSIGNSLINDSTDNSLYYIIYVQCPFIHIHRNDAEKGSNPVWNEKFTFRVEYPGSGGEYKLILKIMEKDQFSADDFVGETIIHVEDLLALGVENGAYELHPCKYRVVSADQSYCGEIEVGITFTLREEVQLEEQEVGGWKESNYDY